MGKVTIGVLAAGLGLAVGLAIGIVVVKQACKDRIVGAVEDAASKLGAGSTVSKLAGTVARAFVDQE